METLKEKYKDYFLIGAAVNTKTIKTHRELLIEHFNCLTCENDMKWGVISKKVGNYEFNRADDIVSFARNNGMVMRGHTMVWHNQIPEDLLVGRDKDALLQEIKKHSKIFYDRYKKDIFCMDVVNEAICDDDSAIMRNSGWITAMGDDFMVDVFHAVKEAMPEIQLFYNDYNESYYNKTVKIADKLRDMQNRGVPVDGVGLQCHWNIFSPKEDEIKRAMELYASLGLRIHITEMDVSMFEFSDRSHVEKPSKDMVEKQIEVYDRAFKLFREYKELIDCVTLWGVADDETWLDNFPVRNRKNWPLLFDAEHNKKEVFHRIMNF